MKAYDIIKKNESENTIFKREKIIKLAFSCDAVILNRITNVVHI